MAKFFSAADIPDIVLVGKRYQKVSAIWAVPIAEAGEVETKHGTVTNVPAGCFIATDGKSVWPIAAGDMADTYVELKP